MRTAAVGEDGGRPWERARRVGGELPRAGVRPGPGSRPPPCGPPQGVPPRGTDQGKETRVDGTVEVPAGTVEAPVLLMTWL
ncbi:hypothetical protein Smic_27500 [Streptomyces microflavus]|uniref:Uncharacterized protein n=1 Tax=Streptomyces microflavus TaxID=1919 RepID=A0A7J0CQJ3_STRMI|nr:hypothetical protein Smic_27500 [Streptomyces microflavus]